MPAQVNLNKTFYDEPIKIPFEDGNISWLRLRLNKDIATPEQKIEKAVNKYITYYFPEFYRNMRDPDFDGDQTVYNDLRETLKGVIRIENPGYALRPPSNTKQFVLFKLEAEMSMREFRAAMSAVLPDFQDNLVFFNQENNISQDLNGVTEIALSSLGTTAHSMGALMNKFEEQKQNYGGAVNVSGVDFGFLSTSITKILALIVKGLAKDLKGVQQGGQHQTSYTEGDVLTLYFSNKTDAPDNPPPPDPLNVFTNTTTRIAITAMTYVAADATPGVEFVKVGYFSLMKYKKIFSDQMTLKILRRVDDILEQERNAAATGRPTGMLNFMSDMALQAPRDEAAGEMFTFPTENDPNTDSDALIQEAIRLKYLDPTDDQDLQQGIKALTDDELAALRHSVEQNPELFEKVYQQEKKQKLQTGVDVTDTIGKALEFGPLALFEDGSAVDKIMQKFGLKALAREAMICLTFGVNFEIQRITNAIGDVLQDELNEPYRSTEENNTRFAFDLEMPLLKIFSIKGDLWKVVLDAILSSISEALITLIQQLTQLLKEACTIRNPRAEDFGSVDIPNLLGPTIVGPNSNSPFGFGNDENSPFGNLIDLTGCSGEEILTYLNDVSGILSSIDICLLMQSDLALPEGLLTRIAEFNETYPTPCISANLSDLSQVADFWSILSTMADVSELCNEIINDLIYLNQNNICLTEDDLAQLSLEEQNNIEELLDLIENGFDDAPPIYNFDCPDAENFINDPVITRLVPETLSDLIEFVEMQFISSTDAIKNVLLEATLGGPGPLSPYEYAASELTNPDDWMRTPKTNALNTVKDTFNDIADATGPIRDAIEMCLLDTPGLLNPEIRDVGNAVNGIIDVLRDPEVQGAFEGIATKLEIAAALPENTPMITTYAFNQEFFRRFSNYIDIGKASRGPNSSKTFQIPNHLYSYYTWRAGFNIDATFKIQFSFPKFTSDSTKQRIVLRYPRYEGDGNWTGQPAGAQSAEHTHPHINYNDHTIHPNDNPDDQTPSSSGYVDEHNVHGDTSYPGDHLHPVATALGTSIPTPPTSPDPAPGQPGRPPLTPVPLFFNLNDLLQSSAEKELEESMEFKTIKSFGGASLHLNLDEFVDAVTGAAASNGTTFVDAYIAESRFFPYAYGLLTDQIFEYYVENGVFTAAALQQLNFFHDNSNCEPGTSADLLDVEGIFNEVQQEYMQQACTDATVPPRTRMRSVMKYAMYLLLVQVHVAEFVIKNIFLFSAVQLNEVFANEFIVSYMRDEILGSLTRYFEGIGERGTIIEIKNSLIDLFNKKMVRPITVSQGGILDNEGNVVFPLGTYFLREEPLLRTSRVTPTAIPANASAATFNDIIDYLAIIRIQASMGTTADPGSVSNAIRKALPTQNQLTQDQIFLSSMPVLQGISPADSKASIGALKKDVPLISVRGNATARSWTSERRDAAFEKIEDILNDRSRILVTKNVIGTRAKNSTDFPILGSVWDRSKIQYSFWMYVDRLGGDGGAALYQGDVSWKQNKRNIIKLFDVEDFDFGPEVAALWAQAEAALDENGAAHGALNVPEKTMIRNRVVKKYKVESFSSQSDPVPFVPSSLAPEEMAHIIADPKYQQYFSTVFNKEIIGIVPIIQNFYLTDHYFPAIETTMASTKDRVLSMMETILRGDDRYDGTPRLGRTAASNHALNSSASMSTIDPESMARDFILKMLIKTPIDILKGVLEIIDPHVSTTKMIKTGTGAAFNAISAVLAQMDLLSEDDPAYQEALALDPNLPPAPFAPGADAGDLFVAILCVVNELLQNPLGFDGAPDLNLFPRISIDGVDFLGTGMGIYMTPPTPLGYLYLLLQLINWDAQSDVDINLDINSPFGSGGVNVSDSTEPTDCEEAEIAIEETTP
jgi:hypothetical protein